MGDGPLGSVSRGSLTKSSISILSEHAASRKRYHRLFSCRLSRLPRNTRETFELMTFDLYTWVACFCVTVEEAMSGAVDDSVKLVASLDPQLACIAARAWGKLDSVSICTPTVVIAIT